MNGVKRLVVLGITLGLAGVFGCDGAFPSKSCDDCDGYDPSIWCKTDAGTLVDCAELCVEDGGATANQLAVCNPVE